MRTVKLLATFLSVLLLSAPSMASGDPWIGALAPDFRLQDQQGQWHQLSDYRGRWVVLYFYPKDGTPGCTVEARNFRDTQAEFARMGVQVIGVSLDDVKSHKVFAETEQLTFPILSDSERKAAEAYKVLGGFGPVRYTRRETFVIDPEGTIVQHYGSVDAETHARQLLADLPKWMQSGL
jgi:peroxiredoxin Q/BCP